MLGTIVIDAYKKTETAEIVDALDGLIYHDCWSSAGIYSFWNYTTKEILYFGLAADLSARFKQHNGLTRARKEHCKKEQIAEYFKANEKLGYSIMLQSSLSQPATAKFKKEYKSCFASDPDLVESFGKDGRDNIKLLEGINLEAFRLKNGNLPMWNAMNGSSAGQQRATIRNYQLTELFAPVNPNGNVSRVTLRELNNDGGFRAFECFLHGARISFYSFAKFLEFNRMGGNGYIIDRLFNEAYLKRRLVV
jgi:hypothetical protein